jgi:sterol desaturase/sphingolipid hydroxylase (fatty acid hydroxylase superfamily)
LPRHINKNYGEVFAIWDWLFGTLYVPKEREKLVLGLRPGGEQPHASIAKVYVRPFIDFWAVVTRRDRKATA